MITLFWLLWGVIGSLVWIESGEWRFLGLIALGFLLSKPFVARNYRRARRGGQLGSIQVVLGILNLLSILIVITMLGEWRGL